MKKALRRFFFENKLGKAIIKSVAVLNTFEGIVHLIVAFVGIWGLVDTGSYDIRLWVAPIENLIFGVFSILTGYILGMDHH